MNFTSYKKRGVNNLCTDRRKIVIHNQQLTKSANETIEYAAVKYRLINRTDYMCLKSRSHADCIKIFAKLDIPPNERSTIYGFITSNGRFVDRYEAKEIAIKSKQVDTNYQYDGLFSEYIKWTTNNYCERDIYEQEKPCV